MFSKNRQARLTILVILCVVLMFLVAVNRATGVVPPSPYLDALVAIVGMFLFGNAGKAWIHYQGKGPKAPQGGPGDEAGN